MTINDYDIYEFKELNKDYLLFTVMNKKGSIYTGLCDYSGNVLLEPIYGNIEYFDGFNFLIVSKYTVLSDEKSFILPLKDIKDDSYVGKKYEMLNNCVVNENYDSDINKVKYLTITYDNQSKEKEHIVLDKIGDIVYTTEHDISYCNDDMFLEKRKDTSHEIPYYYFKSFYNVKKKKYLSQTGKYANSDIIGNGTFYGGLCRLRLSSSIDENRYFYINTEGIVYGNYYYCTDFHKDKKTCEYRAIIQDEYSNISKIVDNKFNTIFTFNWSNTYILEPTDYNVYIIIDKQTKLKSVINFEGDRIIPNGYEKITITSNGIISCIDNKTKCYYNLDGKKLDIEEGTWFEDINDKICIANKILDDKTVSTIIDSDGNNIFNKWFDDVIPNLTKQRIMLVNKEVSYNANNIYEYKRYSVIDIDGNVIFSYPENGKYNDLMELYTEDYSFYIGKTRNMNEYVLLNKYGIEINRFISEKKPKIFGKYFSYKEEDKYNLYCCNGKMIFYDLFDLVNKGKPSDDIDYLNIINDKCFEYYVSGERFLYIDNDIVKNKNDNMIMDHGNDFVFMSLEKKKKDGLIRRLFRR